MKKLYDNTSSLFAEVIYSNKISNDVNKHYHCMFSIAAIKNGNVSVEIDNNEPITLNKNSLAIFNPHQVHRSLFKNNSTKGFYELYLNKNWCTTIQNEIFGNELDFIDIDTNLLNSQTLYRKFTSIMDAILNDTKGLNFEKVLKSFVYELFENYCDINYLNKKNDAHYNILNTARQYILRNIQRDITLDMLSNYLGFSKSYVIRIFKETYGQTPYAYILNLKINMAKELISKEKNPNIGDIAYAAGFYDQSHFTKSFKKIYGVNPIFYKN